MNPNENSSRDIAEFDDELNDEALDDIDRAFACPCSIQPMCG